PRIEQGHGHGHGVVEPRIDVEDHFTSHAVALNSKSKRDGGFRAFADCRYSREKQQAAGQGSRFQQRTAGIIPREVLVKSAHRLRRGASNIESNASAVPSFGFQVQSPTSNPQSP